MVVHVRLRVRPRGGRTSMDIVVLVNGGAHSSEPVLVVDEITARDLGFTSGEPIEVSTADSRRRAFLVRDAVELTLIDETGRELSTVRAHLVIHPGLEEPLITDITIDELGIQVISFSRGLWRHVSDPPGIARRSARQDLARPRSQGA